LTRSPGSPPGPRRLPHGCSFAPRCARRMAECRRTLPEPRFPSPDRMAACLAVFPWFAVAPSASAELLLDAIPSGTMVSGGFRLGSRAPRHFPFSVPHWLMRAASLVVAACEAWTRAAVRATRSNHFAAVLTPDASFATHGCPRIFLDGTQRTARLKYFPQSL